jgi:hypothetical protein
MTQVITLGEKTLAFGRAAQASAEDGLRLVQDYLRIEREDLRKEILMVVTKVLRIQEEKGCYGSANDNPKFPGTTWAANVKNSEDIAANAAMTWKSVQSNIFATRAQIAQLKRSISEFKLPNSEF